MTIHLRKMYVDCRYGQLHMHTAFPSSGGFDELTPLVCIAPPQHTGRIFRPLLSEKMEGIPPPQHYADVNA